MHVSGVVIRIRAGQAGAVVPALRASAGLTVDRIDDAGGHIIAVLESPSGSEQEEGLRRLQMLPGVLGAALVAHYFEPEDGATDSGATN